MTLYLTNVFSVLAYTSRLYSESLSMHPAVSYIPYGTSSHEQTGNIITFAQFEERNSVENKHNAEEDESILDSIDESSTENDSDKGYISTSALKDNWDRR